MSLLPTRITWTKSFCFRGTVPILFALLSVSIATAADPVPIAKHDRWVTSLVFSPDGNSLISGGGEGLPYRPGDVKLWDAKSGAAAASLDGQTSIVWGVAISSDGTKLLTSGYDGKTIVWSVPDKKAIVTVEKRKGWCRSVAFTPDAKHFAYAGEDGNVTIYSTEGMEVKTFKCHEAAVYDVAFSPDGATLATASTDKTAKLFDWNAGTEKAKLEGHGDAVWAVTYSKDGALLATCGADRKIKLWSTADNKEQATLEGHKDWVSNIAFSPDGLALASSSHDRSVKLWDVKEKKEAATLGGFKSTVWCVAFSPDGKQLAAGSHKDSIRVYDVTSKNEVFPHAAEVVVEKK